MKVTHSDGCSMKLPPQNVGVAGRIISPANNASIGFECQNVFKPCGNGLDIHYAFGKLRCSPIIIPPRRHQTASVNAAGDRQLGQDENHRRAQFHFHDIPFRGNAVRIARMVFCSQIVLAGLV
ncbi:MAG TPA: hypothetical protein VIK53_02115 [Verrucomicrobiae bacterium]